MFSVHIARSLIRNCPSALRSKPVIYQQLLRRLKSSKDTEITTSNARSEIDTNVKPLGEKVKEATKTVSYLGVILLGVGVTGSLFYAVFSELLSSKSPNSVYSRASKRCIEDYRVKDKLGEPITVYGEETRRRRRQHVSHAVYLDKEGKKHLRMQFHLKGAFHSGTAHLDMVENDSGDYEYRYLFVEIDDMLKNTIVVEDNRNTQSSQVSSFDELKY